MQKQKQKNRKGKQPWLRHSLWQRMPKSSGPLNLLLSNMNSRPLGLTEASLVGFMHPCAQSPSRLSTTNKPNYDDTKRWGFSSWAEPEIQSSSTYPKCMFVYEFTSPQLNTSTHSEGLRPEKLGAVQLLPLVPFEATSKHLSEQTSAPAESTTDFPSSA